MKNQKGITLIALVITIIVLLILAGISIAMLAGDNGVLNKASDSKIVSALGTKKDEVNLAAAEGLSDYYEAVYVNNTTTSAYNNSELATAIQNRISARVQSDADITVEVSNYTITLTSIAKPSLKTTGTINSGSTGAGSITWVDEFKTAQ